MALKDKWVDKINGVDFVNAQDINEIAHTAIFCEEQFGEGNVRGFKGYWIEAVSPNYKQLRLSLKTDRNSVGQPTIYSTKLGTSATHNTGYEVGNEFSIITPKNHHILCGKITAITNNVITYELYIEANEINWNTGEPTDNDDYSFVVPAKSTTGIVSISSGGFTSGDNNISGGNFTTTSGYGNNAAGNFGDAGGLETIAGYCAFSRGANNQSVAKYSGIPAGINNKVGAKGLQGFIGGGNNNEVNGYSSSARNGQNKVYTDYGDASGFGNTIEKSASGSSISGQFNTIQEGAHSVNCGGYSNVVYKTGLAGFVSGITNWLKSKAGHVGGEDCHSSESWYQFLHGHGLRGGNKLAQAIFGRYNNVNDDAVFQVGNGVTDTARSNAFEVISTRVDAMNYVSIKVGNTIITEEQLKRLLTLI